MKSKLITETKHNYIRNANCIICGKKFRVIIRKKDRKILTDCFHSYIHTNYFLKWTYPLESLELISLPWYKRIFKREKVHFDKKLSKPLWLWKILGCCRPSRWLVYNIWKLFYGWKKFEYWECTECANRSDDQ